MKKDNSMHHIENQREKDLDYSVNLNQLWDESSGENIDKLRAFARHVPYMELSKFVLKYELFKKIVNTNGSIIECGVFNGNGLFTWATLSSILEPVNHTRKIIGFDTFEGFPSVATQDKSKEALPFSVTDNEKYDKPTIGMFSEDFNIMDELNGCIDEYNDNTSTSK